MRHLYAMFGVGVLCLLVALGMRLVALSRLDERAGPPTLFVTRERPRPAGTLCDECPLPGDVIKADIRGPSSMIRGVAVYHGFNEEHVKSCVNCDGLSLVADMLGRYVIVGFQMARSDSCVLPCANWDVDVSALERCGATVVTSEVVVR